jgi:hypothetical protein
VLLVDLLLEQEMPIALLLRLDTSLLPMARSFQLLVIWVLSHQVLDTLHVPRARPESLLSPQARPHALNVPPDKLL